MAIRPETVYQMVRGDQTGVWNDYEFRHANKAEVDAFAKIDC